MWKIWVSSFHRDRKENGILNEILTSIPGVFMHAWRPYPSTKSWCSSFPSELVLVPLLMLIIVSTTTNYIIPITYIAREQSGYPAITTPGRSDLTCWTRSKYSFWLFACFPVVRFGETLGSGTSTRIRDEVTRILVPFLPHFRGLCLLIATAICSGRTLNVAVWLAKYPCLGRILQGKTSQLR